MLLIAQVGNPPLMGLLPNRAKACQGVLGRVGPVDTFTIDAVCHFQGGNRGYCSSAGVNGARHYQMHVVGRGAWVSTQEIATCGKGLAFTNQRW